MAWTDLQIALIETLAAYESAECASAICGDKIRGRGGVRRLPDRICAGCGKTFRPRKAINLYCQQACYLPPTPRPLTREWIAERVKETPAGCWEWQLYRDPNGYGRVKHAGRNSQLAHRVVYTTLVGEIPLGLTIDHLCRNTSCVNPEHLRAATQRENILASDGPSARQARQTHCKRGHELSGDNLRTYQGQRTCRECHRQRQRADAAKRRAA